MKKMKRVVLIVLDGAGAGWQADADKYGDVGANTLGHVIEQMHPEIPNLTELGLMKVLGMQPADEDEPIGCYGAMLEKAAGKDTPPGHWEIAGLTLDKPFPTYPNGFPQKVIDEFERETGMGVIGNKVASGTEIIEELGAEHIRTGKLIVYTSADSVFQIAANEAIVPLEELYRDCQIARELLTGELEVGRVIARPFVGDHAGAFKRTGARRDFSAEISLTARQGCVKSGAASSSISYCLTAENTAAKILRTAFLSAPAYPYKSADSSHFFNRFPAFSSILAQSESRGRTKAATRSALPLKPSQ